MKPARWLAVLVVWGSALADVRSQVAVVPVPPGGDGFAFGFRRHGRHTSVSGFVSNSFGYGYYPFYPPVGLPVSRITVLNFSSPPVVVNPAPVVVAPVVQVGPINVNGGPAAERDDFDDEVALPRRRRVAVDRQNPLFDVFRPQPRGALGEPPMAEAPDDGQAMPGAPASVYRPLKPEDRARPWRPEQRPPEQPRAEKKPAPRPPEEPEDAYARQMRLGADAFARQEYARAERFFRQATAITPDESRPYFLLAQTQFALAKYQEAFASVQAGMRLRPDWPEARFRPRALYGPNATDYDEQLTRLRDALGRFPRDPVLLFLLAYQLWFDERQDEARPLFERARPLAPDKALIDRFLQGRPTGPVAANR